MAEDKEDKEGDSKAKKKLSPLIMVAAGAILGGAAVVFLAPTPKHEPQPHQEEVVSHEPILWEPPDVELDFRFNPQVERGKAFAQISFTISFMVQPGKQEEAGESMKSRLNQAKSRCLELLAAQSVTEFSSVDGKKHLKRLLMDELTYSLFPGYKGERIATVNDIFWTKFLIQ